MEQVLFDVSSVETFNPEDELKITEMRKKVRDTWKHQFEAAIEEARITVMTENVKQFPDPMISSQGKGTIIKIKGPKQVEHTDDGDNHLALFKRLVRDEKLQREQEEEHERLCMSSPLDSTFEWGVETIQIGTAVLAKNGTHHPARIRKGDSRHGYDLEFHDHKMARKVPRHDILLPEDPQFVKVPIPELRSRKREMLRDVKAYIVEFTPHLLQIAQERSTLVVAWSSSNHGHLGESVEGDQTGSIHPRRVSLPHGHLHPSMASPK